MRSLLILLFLLKISYIDLKCVNSFVTTCESVSDITKFGKKHWTNLLIQPNICEDYSIHHNREILKTELSEKCPNLEELYIINKIDFIENNAFDSLSALNYLNLYKNNLKVIPNYWFTNLNLYKLELKNNNIESIAEDAFKNTTKLKILNLADNKLNEINDKTYVIKSLKKLIISGNIISTIKPNVFPHNLEILDLSDNELRHIDDNTFINLNHLKELQLSRNKMKKLKKNMFAGLDNLFKLDISHNAIDTIEVTCFDGLVELKILQLAHNNLKVFKPDVFPKNNAMILQSLRLDHNKMNYLNLTVFERLPTLRRISIGGNPWQCSCLHELQTEMNERNVNFTPCDFQHYFNGTHPSCLQFKTGECVKNINGVEDNFSVLYKNALQNFSYDCP